MRCSFWSAPANDYSNSMFTVSTKIQDKNVDNFFYRLVVVLNYANWNFTRTKRKSFS